MSRKIWEMLSTRERRGMVSLLALMVVGMTLETIGIGLVVPAVALLAQSDFTERVPAMRSLLESLGNPGKPTLILGAMSILTVCFLFKNVFLAFLAWRQARFAFDVQAQLSHRLFAGYLRQPYVFHLQRNSAELLRNVIGEVSLFTNGVMIPGLLLISELMVMIGICALLLLVEPLGAIIVVSIVGAAGWAFLHLTRGRIARWGVARQHHEGQRLQHVQQGLGGVKDVKLLGREAEFLAQYNLHNLQSSRVGHLQSTIVQMPRLWLELLAVGGLTALVFTMLSRGRPIEAILPMLGLFAAAAFRLMPSANRVIGAAQSLRYGLPVIDTLHSEVGMDDSDVEPEPSRSASEPFASEIAMQAVTFKYPGAANAALDAISIVVRSGESVGFIGPSGGGKSTLVDVMLGLLKPDSGEVMIGSRNLYENLRGWQDQIGYVPQSIFLTDDSLRRNVAFGVAADKIDDTAVWRALRAAQLDEFVQTLPKGLDTEVGERGIRLSGGQRQRVGIARALYHDPPVLVLDEATSALDAATESGVMDAVRALKGAKTTIIVAHRFTTVEHCDRLYRISKGAIVEEGPPHQLLRPSRHGEITRLGS